MTASILTSFSSPSWLPFWYWVEIFSTLAVAIGCFGEGKAEQNHLREKYKRLFWRMIWIGLAVEMLGFSATFRISGIEIEALKSTNLAQQAELEKLRVTALDRRITPKEKEDFINFTKDLPKFPVRIITASGLGEPWNYARMVRDMLDAAQYDVKDGDGITEVPGLTHLTHIGDSTMDFPLSIGIYGKDNSALQWPGMTIRYEGKYAIFGAEKGEVPPPLLMENALNKVGVPTSFGSSAQYLKPGEWAVFIPAK